MVILDKFAAFISKITERRWHAASLLKFLGQKVDWPNKGSFSVARASFQNSGEQHYDAIRNTISNLRQVMNWRFIPLRMPTVPCKHVAQSHIGEKKTVSNSCICYCIIAYTIRNIVAYKIHSNITFEDGRPPWMTESFKWWEGLQFPRCSNGRRVLRTPSSYCLSKWGAASLQTVNFQQNFHIL